MIGQTSPRVSPMILMATRSLINMVVVGATSGAALLTLLAANHFERRGFAHDRLWSNAAQLSENVDLRVPNRASRTQ